MRLTTAEAERQLRRMLRRLRLQAGDLAEAQLISFREELQILLREFERELQLLPALTVFTVAQAGRILELLDAVLESYAKLLAGKTADNITRVIGTVVTEYVRVHQLLMVQSGRAAGEVTTVFRVVPGRTLSAMFRQPGRVGFRSVEELARRHAREAQVAVTTYIRSITGRTPTRTAVRALTAMLAGELPVQLGGVPGNRAETAPVRSLSSRGTRLLSTETLIALRLATAEASAASPIILVAQWTLSDRHAGLPSSPDVCDQLAEQNVGFGPGWYPPERYPAAPHPYCGCYQGEVKVLNPTQWPSG